MEWRKLIFEFFDFAKNQRSKTAWAITSCLVAINLVWLRWAYQQNDWKLADLFLITDVSFVCALLGIKTVEKMHENKIKKEILNKEPEPTKPIVDSPTDSPEPKPEDNNEQAL